MRRRSLLAALAAAPTAGCTGVGRQAGDAGRTGGGTTDDAPSLAETGYPPSICETEPKSDPGIYAIDDPAVGDDWSGLNPDDRYGSEGSLVDDRTVIGVEYEGRVRAYPLSIVWHHEIVNDHLGGPILVTYCPICRSGMVSERRIGGAVPTFEVTGELWRPPGEYTGVSEAQNRTFGVDETEGERTDVHDAENLVLVDDTTGSYWSQLLGQAICGPEKGMRLTTFPGSVATWGEWRAEHPDTDVLLPPPYSGTVQP